MFHESRISQPQATPGMGHGALWCPAPEEELRESVDHGAQLLPGPSEETEAKEARSHGAGRAGRHTQVSGLFLIQAPREKARKRRRENPYLDTK